MAGGQTNTASGAYATVGGGASNRALGTRSIVAGGYANLASNTYATVGGGYANRAQGTHATVPGGSANVATGANSFAAGTRAKANHQGAFVWGDSTAADVASTANNQFIVRATGGLWLGTTSTPSIPAGRFIQTSTGAYLSSGGAWTNASDRNVKANIVAVDPQVILAKVAQMPVALWNYKSEDATVKHIGPMAQDFRAAFGVGEDATHISTVDADGVALAAIQGLYWQNQQLKAQNQQVIERLMALEQAQRGGSRAVHVASAGLMLSWSMVAAMLGGLCFVLLLVCVGLGALMFRRRDVRA